MDFCTPSVAVMEDAVGYTFGWKHLHLDLVEEIFRHISTVQRVKYRRVSLEWNHLLCDEGSGLSAALIFCPEDLVHYPHFCWKNFRKWDIHNSPKETFFRGLVTRLTKMLVIDYQLTSIEPEEKRELPRLLQYYPQIRTILLGRLKLHFHDQIYSDDCYTGYISPRCNCLWRNLGCGVKIGVGRSVTLYGCRLINGLRIMTSESPFENHSARNALPTTILRCEALMSDDDFRRPLFENIIALSWPHATQRLMWIESFLKRMEQEDPGTMAKQRFIKDFGFIRLTSKSFVHLTHEQREAVPEGRIVFVNGQFLCRLLGNIVPFEVMADITEKYNRSMRSKQLVLYSWIPPDMPDPPSFL